MLFFNGGGGYMITNREERNGIARVNNRVLKEVISKAIKDEQQNLKLADEKKFRIYQGKLVILEDILALLK